MFAIIGVVLVFACVITGFLMEKGKLGVLVQPAELVTIGGAAIGTVLSANPMHVLKKMISGVLGILKGSPRKAEAIKLAQYHLTTESQGRFAELMGYPPANSAAYALLSAEKRANLPEKYADRGMMQAGTQYLNFWLDNGDSLRQRFATFTAQ